jgi:hypothetical protein
MKFNRFIAGLRALKIINLTSIFPREADAVLAGNCA